MPSPTDTAPTALRFRGVFTTPEGIRVAACWGFDAHYAAFLDALEAAAADAGANPDDIEIGEDDGSLTLGGVVLGTITVTHYQAPVLGGSR